MLRGRIYRLVMRIAHRYNWHYAPPIYPDGDTMLWCKWCGMRYVTRRKDDKPAIKGLTMSRIQRKVITLEMQIAVMMERTANARYLGEQKSGKEREAWLDDANDYASILQSLRQLQALTKPA